MPSGLTLVVVGDVDEELAVQTVSRAVADWDGGEVGQVKVPDAPPAAARSIVAVPMMNKSQADVAYGFVGIRRHDLDYTAISVMNNALGQYAIGGRLGDSIRERQGMAYYVFSALEAGFGQGPLMIRAGVSAENVERTIASIDAELNAVLNDGFTEKEIDESKSYLVGSIPRQLETNAAIAAFLLNAEFYGLGLDYDVRLPGLIQAITLEDANKAARRLLDPARATIAVAGPWTPSPSALPPPPPPPPPPKPAPPSALRDVLQRHDAETKAAALKVGRERPAWVFPSIDGTLLERANVEKAFKRVLRHAGLLLHFTPHSLRHSYASLLLADEVSVAYVQEQLGHSSIKMTVDTYGRWLRKKGAGRCRPPR